LTDTKLGLVDILITNELLPNEEIDYAGSDTIYTLLITDLAAGEVLNTATVSAVNFKDEPITASSDDSNGNSPVSVSLPCTNGISSISITKNGSFKDANINNCADLGEKIEYDFTIRNTGDVTLRNIFLTDTKLSLTDIPITSELLPGKSIIYSGLDTIYTLLISDLATGEVLNTATVSAINFKDEPITASSDDSNGNSPVSVSLPCTNGISSFSITKNGSFKDANLNNCADLGEEIEYDFTIKNTGDVTLRNILLTDIKLGLVDITITGELLPNEEIDYTGPDTIYTLLITDLAAGEVLNTATVSAINFKDEPITASSDDSNSGDPTKIELPCTTGQANLKIIKKGIFISDDECADLNDRISYSFSIKNEGDVTLRFIKLTDTKLNLSNIAITDELLPESEIVFTPQDLYQISLADLANGFVGNTATASTINFKDELLSFSSIDENNNLTTRVELPCTLGDSEISIVKTGQFEGVDENDCAAIDKKINYTFTITNTGEVTLRNIKLTDALLEINNLEVIGVLKPGDVTIYEANYSLDFDDLLAGAVMNNADVMAINYQNNSITADAVDDQGMIGNLVTLPCEYDLAVTKEVNNVKPSVGDTITFTIVVENTGGIPASNITVVDDLEDVFTHLSSKASAGMPVLIGRSIEWNIPSLDGGKTANLEIEVLVNDEEVVDQNDYFNTVTITNSGGRLHEDVNPANDTATRTLEPLCVRVYELFSPNNGDDFNKYLEIRCIKDDFPNNKLKVYNRWGSSVYSKRGYGQGNGDENKWNGRLNGSSSGNILPAGTYFYTLELGDGETAPMSGWIQLE
jgi:uncharacterized repeat protein (TIGR01451 family)/gliding motility-associated-like protein